MIILIDTNEVVTNPKMVNQIRLQFVNEQVTIANLSVGDIHVPLPTGLLIIERKAVGDLLSSIADGRLFNQVERMVELAMFPAMIVHGSLAYDTDDLVIVDHQSTQWQGRSVRAAILAVQWAGCPVIMCASATYANTVTELISLATKPDHAQKPDKHRSITFPPIDQRVEILAQFPGVGYKRAEAILRFVAVQQGKLGRLCDAIEWATLFSFITEESRPEGWGEKTLVNFRATMGLNDDEALIVQKEKKNDKR